MMKEVAKELPSVKEVLIDERDRYLATSIYTSEGKRKVAVIGAGHTQGIIRNFGLLEKGELSTDTSSITEIPKPGKAGRLRSGLCPFSSSLLLQWVSSHPDGTRDSRLSFTG